jgi:hypothetical protein
MAICIRLVRKKFLYGLPEYANYLIILFTLPDSDDEVDEQ